MTAEFDTRQEHRLYHAKTMEELEDLFVELAPIGWNSTGKSMCPLGCRCGKGPYWGIFVMDLPTTSAKDLN